SSVSRQTPAGRGPVPERVCVSLLETAVRTVFPGVYRPAGTIRRCWNPTRKDQINVRNPETPLRGVAEALEIWTLTGAAYLVISHGAIKGRTASISAPDCFAPVVLPYASLALLRRTSGIPQTVNFTGYLTWLIVRTGQCTAPISSQSGLALSLADTRLLEGPSSSSSSTESSLLLPPPSFAVLERQPQSVSPSVCSMASLGLLLLGAALIHATQIFSIKKFQVVFGAVVLQNPPQPPVSQRVRLLRRLISSSSSSSRRLTALTLPEYSYQHYC
ncbi:hypothetical protein AMECASPLE_008382, partial [Ameca splendens]